MNTSSLQHRLTDAERASFARDGFLLVPGALDREQTEYFGAVVDDIDCEQRRAQKLAKNETLNLHDVIGTDARMLDLIDWPTTFPKVWGLMGWNIQLYHTQLMTTPPREGEFKAGRWGWHQDNNCMNRDIHEVELQPMISLKVAYFLSDVSAQGCGNFAVVPGSHLTRALVEGENGDPNPRDRMEVVAKPGDALLFDRRLWHAGSHNWGDRTRKALFYGYSYRWLKNKCDMKTNAFWDSLDPIRLQLLGATPTGAQGLYDPQPADVPLRTWIEANAGADVVMA